MEFEMWLFAIKKLAPTYDVAQLIFEQMTEEAKKELLEEYNEYIAR